MATATPTASFKISTSNASFFVDEVKGDVILYAGDSNQRILIGNTHEHTAMLALTSNDAVVHGNFASTNVSTNYVKSTGVELSMSDPTLLPTYSANDMISGNPGSYDLATTASNLAAIASNQAFPLGNLVRSNGDSNVVLRVEHAYPTVFTSNTTFTGSIVTSNTVYMTSNLTVCGVLAASNAAFTNATFANTTFTDTTSINSATFAGPVVSRGLTHTSNAAFFSSNASFLGDAVFVGAATFSNDLTVYGNLNAMSLTYQHSNIVVYNNEEVRSNLAVSGSLTASNIVVVDRITASNASLTGMLRASGVDVTGAFTVNGAPLALSGTSSDTNVSFSNCGTEIAPLAGGNLSLTSSAIVELTSTAEPLHVTLDNNTLFDSSKIGKKGNIVLVERSPAGRILTLDPRIHFATNMNLTPTGFDASSMASTTLPLGFTTTAAPASGGFAVDTIDYFIPKPGFAIGNYYRQFKCMPPTFDETALTGTTHSGIANAAAYTFDVAGLLAPAYTSYYGPLAFSVPPSTVSNVSIGAASGVITVQRNTSCIGSIVVSIEGVAGVTTRTLAFDVKPWYAPVIVDAIPGMSPFQNTNTAAFVTPAPSMQHGADYTGTLTWSADLTGLPAGTSIAAATGRVTVPQASNAFQGSVTITATGPAPSYYSTSSTYSVNIVNYQTPAIDALASPQVGCTGAAPFSLIPQQTAGNVAGTLTWSLSPETLTSTTGVSFEPTTGALEVALHTAINVSVVTITATGPTGLSASRTFALSITPWVDPKFTTDYVTENHATITSSYVLAGPTVQQAWSMTGDLVWSVTPSSLTTYLNAGTGALTFPIHTNFSTADVTLTATGPSGETESDTFSLTIVPYATPVISAIANTTVYTGPGASSLAAPSQTASNVGAITWSFIGTPPAGVGINAGTGVITVAQNSVFGATSVTVKATGPVTSIYGTTSFQLSAVLWATPVITAIAEQILDSTSTIVYVTPALVSATNAGTITWSVSTTGSTALSSYFTTSTGKLTFPSATVVARESVTIRATGPTGLYGEVTFYLTVKVVVLARFPEYNLTSNSDANYVVTASSDVVTQPPYNLFSTVGGSGGLECGIYNATTGTYSGSGSTTYFNGTTNVTTAGSWVQLYSTLAHSLSSYKWTDGGFQSMPSSWVVVASNDGSAWVLVDSRSGQSIPLWGNSTYTLSTTTASYLYYRVVITKCFASSCRPFHLMYYGF